MTPLGVGGVDARQNRRRALWAATRPGPRERAPLQVGSAPNPNVDHAERTPDAGFVACAACFEFRGEAARGGSTCIREGVARGDQPAYVWRRRKMADARTLGYRHSPAVEKLGHTQSSLNLWWDSPCQSARPIVSSRGGAFRCETAESCKVAVAFRLRGRFCSGIWGGKRKMFEHIV